MPECETITKCVNIDDGKIHQGDIITNVEYLEYADIIDDNIEIAKIRFPKVVVLTQECDSFQDCEGRLECYKAIEKGETNYNNNSFLLSTIVAPLYVFDDFAEGKQLSEISVIPNDDPKNNPIKLATFPHKSKIKLPKNENPRYHYLKLEINGKYAEYIVDFKHYFTVNTERLIKHRNKGNYFISLRELYREKLNQRFSNYLSRIGLPESEKKTSNK